MIKAYILLIEKSIIFRKIDYATYKNKKLCIIEKNR